VGADKGDMGVLIRGMGCLQPGYTIRELMRSRGCLLLGVYWGADEGDGMLAAEVYNTRVDEVCECAVGAEGRGCLC
jgi:hypothetical protein